MLKRFIFLQEDKISEASTAALEVCSSLEHSRALGNQTCKQLNPCALQMG